jgi:hypothetical protein
MVACSLHLKLENEPDDSVKEARTSKENISVCLKHIKILEILDEDGTLPPGKELGEEKIAAPGIYWVED